MTKVFTVRTVGKADVGEEIIFASLANLKVGDHVFLQPKKPTHAPVYGSAKIVGYAGYNRSGKPYRFVSVRIS
jgi:hypothetical protein